MKKVYKVIIIGGGAAGLAAAAVCGKKFGRGTVAVIEKQKRTGRKLLATGNGRCNISNNLMSEIHYSGDREIISSVLSVFSVADMKKFLSSLGILVRENDFGSGRLYPFSNQSSTVLDMLRLALTRYGVDEITETEIKAVSKQKNQFEIICGNNKLYSEYLIFATGSKASPSLGSDDSGYQLLKQLGIKSTKLFPALSPVATKEKYNLLKGVRAKGAVNVIADGKFLTQEIGEIQFTDHSLSGICVFNVSGAVNEYIYYGTVSGKQCKEMTISLDVMNEYSRDDICNYLRKARQIFRDGKPTEILSAVLNKKLAEVIVSYSGIRKKSCKELDENDIQEIAECVKDFRFTPVQSDAFQSAQVCAGGIGSDEVFSDTLMSKKVRNLYICGELLDVYGKCGGYNLHFAFGSALLVTKNIK